MQKASGNGRKKCSRFTFKDGATLVDEFGEVHSMGNVPGKVLNPVGCGDSMVAGFVAGYSKLTTINML